MSATRTGCGALVLPHDLYTSIVVQKVDSIMRQPVGIEDIAYFVLVRVFDFDENGGRLEIQFGRHIHVGGSLKLHGYQLI